MIRLIIFVFTIKIEKPWILLQNFYISFVISLIFISKDDNIKKTSNYTCIVFLELCKNVFIHCDSIYCAETFVQKILVSCISIVLVSC